MAVEAGAVDVAHVREAHNVVPAEILGKHLERLGMGHEGRQPRGVVTVGDAEQQAVLIRLEPPDGEVAGGGQQTAVVVVDSVAQRVVVDVHLPAGLEEAHLVVETPLAEQPHSLVSLHLLAAEGDVLVDNLLHPPAQGSDLGFQTVSLTVVA